MTICDFILGNVAYSGSWTIYAALAIAAALVVSEWAGSRRGTPPPRQPPSGPAGLVSRRRRSRAG